MFEKNKLKIMLLFIFVIILILGIYYIYENSKTKETDQIDVEEIIVDDRISPLTNQGLIVEILRIRHRGIIDEIFKLSYSWKDPPVSYWITNVDGDECNSLGNIGYGSGGVYTDWDSILKECRVIYWTEDEQFTSDVVISIMVQEKDGILRRVKDVEKERMHLIYNYKTGRWTGDDYLKDKDGYGHYLGENCEIWFNIYQSDYDHDGIPFWTEVNILHTDPMVDDSILDPDYDSIPTSWEYKWGYNPTVWDDHKNLDPDLDGIENIEEYKMRNWFSNPYHSDIYIESDGMEKKNFFDLAHEFHYDSQQMIIERFAQHGINVYIDNGWPNGPINGGGEKLPFIDRIEDVIGGQIAGFYKHHFADERKGIFRYVIIANKLGWNTPVDYNKYDTILVYSGRKPNIKNYFAVTSRLRSILLAKCVLHELGHSMGLMPYTFPGVDIIDPIGFRFPNMPDEDYKNYMNQYNSIMNYDDIYRDIKLFDYSDGSNGAPYDINDWKSLYLPTFQSDARAYEEPADETFEDFEFLLDEIYPEKKGWSYDQNLSISNSKEFEPLVYSDLEISNSYYVLLSDDGLDLKRNIRVYARPDIEPFPVMQSWSLVAEGEYNNLRESINFYSFEEEVNQIFDLINQ